MAAESLSLSSAVLRPVRGHHAFEACVEQLAEAIRIGIFPIGSMLPPERDLAEKLGVSRATVREAITALRSAGMTRTVRGRGGGTFVQSDHVEPLTISDVSRRRHELLDALTYRRVVEPGASFLAASTDLPDDDRRLLERALADAVGAAGERSAHRQADSRLHLAIATVTRCELLVDAVAVVQLRLNEMLTAIPVLQTNMAHSTAQHQAIVTAVLRGRAADARRTMEQHCDDTAALLRGLLGAETESDSPMRQGSPQ